MAQPGSQPPEAVERVPLSWLPHVHRRACSPGSRPERERKAVRSPVASEWTVVEEMLEKRSRGFYRPLQMRGRRRPRQPAPEDVQECRPGVRLLPTGKKAPCGRVTVVTPTTDSRRDFHEQLYAVFDAQDWPDKELVVIETHKSTPSAFFTAKAETDSRIVFHSSHIPSNEEDLSIGTKRNMGTHLASGDWIASFDDDDLYAPSYLSTMLGEMVKQDASAITLGAWYIFEERSGMFGYVDCRGMDGAKLDTQGRTKKLDRDGWLYGFGFSYIFSQDSASDYPYPDKNMGEDYDFFMRLKTRTQTALFFDDFGICLHTLHPRSTSCVQADQEVAAEEVLDLDVVHLGELLTSYMARFPRRGASLNVGRTQRRAERPLTVHLLPFGVDVPLLRAMSFTAKDIKAMAAKAVSLGPGALHLYDAEDCKTCLGDDQRLGVRVQELWARAESAEPEGSRVGVRVVSAGFDAGNRAEFFLGGEKIFFKTQRGLNVVTIDPATRQTCCLSYDVYGDPSALPRLLTDFHGLATGTVVLVAVKDTGLEKLSAEALRALKGVGARLQDHTSLFREGYALVGSKGGSAVAEQVGKGKCVTAVGILRLQALAS